MKTKAFLTGILVGTTIAATAALLMTPVSGRDLRENSIHYLKKASDSLRQFAADGKSVIEQLRSTTQIGKETFIDLSTELKHSIQDWKEDVEPAINQLREDIEALKRTVEQTKKTFS